MSWRKIFHVAIILANLVRLAASWLRHAGWRKVVAPSAPARILVLAYTAVGDFIFLLPALEELRRAFPKARIVCLGNSYPSMGELMPATCLADEIWTIEAPYGYRQAPARTLERIREGKFDAVIVSLPSSARFFGTALFSIPLRIGHCRPVVAPWAGWSWARYGLWRLKRAIVGEELERRLMFNAKVWVEEDGEHMVSRNLRLVEALGVKLSSSSASRPSLPVSAEARAFADQALRSEPIEKLVGLHIGSPQSQYAKVWAPENWGIVCRRLREAYGLRLLLLGGKDEAEVSSRFAASFQGDYVDMIGRCGFLETLELIRRCGLFLGNDTGLSKAAMALDIPTAAVWGPSDRPGYGIIWSPERHLEIYRGIPCSPCICMGLRKEGSGVINFADCGHRACLNGLSPENVFDAICRRCHPLLAGVSG